MARTSGDTMAEGLRKILGDLAQLAALPDGDIEFLTQIQMEIAGYLKNAMSTGGGEQQLPQAPPQGPPVGPAMGLGGGPMPGLAGGMPPMDELARALGPADRAQ